MKKRNLWSSLVVAGVVVSSVATNHVLASSGYAGGSGTQDDPYLISTPQHLNQLQLDVNVNGVDTTGKYYRLTQNIDLSGYDNDSDLSNGNFTPIGYAHSWDRTTHFKGTFDGNGKVISNLKIILPNQSGVGLFGYVDSATIRNVGLEGVAIEGNSKVGSLVGQQYYAAIEQSYAIGDATGSGNYTGGLVGFQDSGDIRQSYAMVDVVGTNGVAGLVAYSSGTISESYSIGNVTGSGAYVGGLIGYAPTAIVENSYWDIETSDQSGSASGIGLTTEQMTSENPKTFMDGFDFDVIWKTTDGYPKFQWQSEVTESTDTVKEVTVNGSVQTMVADVVIPSVSPDLVINPNLPEGFVAPEFSVSNDSVSPIKLELKTFEQVTDTFNDVLPSKYSSWEGLNKTQSKDLALGLVGKEGEGWQSLTTPISYVANHANHEVGIIKPNAGVDFTFDVKHGTAISEAKTVQYKMVFVFDLMG